MVRGIMVGIVQESGFLGVWNLKRYLLIYGNDIRLRD